MILKTILFSIVLLGIAFAGFAVKMFFIKGGQFKKQCSSSIKDPKTGKRLDCAGDSCHTKTTLKEEMEYAKKSPISKRNIRIMTESVS